MSLDTRSVLVIDDCWNRIGVQGDSSCPKLKQHIHCRNCPVYTSAADRLFESSPPDGYLEEWTRQVAQKATASELDTLSVVIFRIDSEWLGIPTPALQEIADSRTIHSLPHRRNGIVLGLANVRGELLVCVSLPDILNLAGSQAPSPQSSGVLGKRLLVLRGEGSRVICPVDEVHGIQRFNARDLGTVPATVAKATATYTQAVLSWRSHSVGLLNEDLLFHTINRNLA